MKMIAAAILTVVLFAAVVHPLIETSNVAKEKALLSAAILSASRAAYNVSVLPNDVRDLSPQILIAEFEKNFPEEFCKTLNLVFVSEIGGVMTFSSSEANGRWNNIRVTLGFETAPSYPGASETTTAVISVDTPYVFRTNLVRAAATNSGRDFNITETRLFEISVES